MADKFKYDIAFSFLSGDEKAAQEINDALQDRYRTFIYTERQKELAGTDGEETFKRVFAKEARIVAVLFRPEWGNTRWTRIEETAIRDRAYEEGYDFCTFVAMTEHIERPDWLPKTRLLYSLKRFGVTGAAVALEARLQEQGVAVREETVTERAQRLKRARDFAEEAEQFRRSTDGVESAVVAVENLKRELGKHCEDVSKATDMHFTFRILPLGYTGVTSPNAVLVFNWHHRYTNSLDKSSLNVGFYDKMPRLPGLIPGFEEPRTLESAKFEFKLIGSSRQAWVSAQAEVVPDNMAEYLMKRLIYHNENELRRKERRR